APMAQRRMPRGRVVEALDVVEDIRPGRLAGPIGPPRRPLGLQGREEALPRRMVPDMAGTGDAAGHAERSQQALEGLTGQPSRWRLAPEPTTGPPACRKLRRL